MAFREWFRRPRPLVLVFFLAATASTAALGWLTWELLARDSADARNRQAEDRERAVDAAIVAIERQLAAVEGRLTLDAAPSGPTGLASPEGFVVLTYSQGEFSVNPPGGVPYYPEASSRSTRGIEALAHAERLELLQSDYESAARAYSAHSVSDDLLTRAMALARLARVQRKQRLWASALATYDRLEELENVDVEGMPALLVTRVGRISILEHELPDSARVRDEAVRLKADLEHGRLRLTKSQFTHWSGEVRRLTGSAPSVDADAWARADAVEWLWRHRTDEPSPGIPRRLVPVQGGTVFVSSRFDRNRLAAIIAGPRALSELVSAAVPKDFAWGLANFEGRFVAGEQPSTREVASRAGSATEMPWTLHLFRRAGSPSPSTRRPLLVSVLVSVAAILVAAWYFIWRGVSREARVARLQSEFVAAVSHEFRSPLTSMRHIAELLATDRMASEERRQRSYELLVAETDRMGRLVEDLLDFGRMQDGRTQFTLEPVDLRELAGQVVSDFSRRLSPDGHRIDLSADSRAAATTVDREAIGRVIWNLLDNAVKYSPGSRHIHVAITRDAVREQVSVSVRDEGLGIPPAEQLQIFDRFVRGTDATRRRIGGTGIGLTMARAIVRAHGGDIRVASELGKGSTFTVALPFAGDRG